MVEALERQRTLTQAALELGLTQPALTKALRELESLLGAPLFERHARGVRPTPAGAAAARVARTALADLRRFEALQAGEGAREGAVVDLGVLPVAAVGLLPAIIRRARLEAPQLQVRMREGRTEELLRLLQSGEIDLALGRLYPPAAPDGLVREALYAEPIGVMARAGHPLQRMARPTVRDLAAFDLVLPEFSQRIAHDVSLFMGSIGLEPSARTIRSTSRGFIREMVLGSDMVTVMPRMMMGEDLMRGQIRVVPVPAPPLHRPAGILTNPRRPLGEGPAALSRLIRRTIADLAEIGGVDITK